MINFQSYTISFQDKETKNYENLSNGTFPNFPNTSKLESTYCAPADLRTDAEQTYATPYIPKTLEELYSKPVPKSLRNEPQNTSLYAELEFAMAKKDLYSKIVPKSNRVKESDCATYQNAAESQYSKISKMKNNEDYTNVFGSPYVNCKSDKSEYAEPSYCEVKR